MLLRSKRSKRRSVRMAAVAKSSPQYGQVPLEMPEILTGASTLDAVYCWMSSEKHTVPFLGEMLKLLKPGCSITTIDSAQGRTFEVSKAVSDNLTLSGFANVGVSSSADNANILMTATKPAFQVGASQSFSRKKKVGWEATTTTAATSSSGSNATASTASTLAATLIDEDALLNDAEKQFKPTSTTDGCAPTRTACANCTCGRAEEEAKGRAAAKSKLTLAMLENPGESSSCGNCSLGDAFRCGGCPYRGLPAFVPGQKIELPDDFLIDA